MLLYKGCSRIYPRGVWGGQHFQGCWSGRVPGIIVHAPRIFEVETSKTFLLHSYREGVVCMNGSMLWCVIRASMASLVVGYIMFWGSEETKFLWNHNVLIVSWYLLSRVEVITIRIRTIACLLYKTHWTFNKWRGMSGQIRCLCVGGWGGGVKSPRLKISGTALSGVW